MADYGIDPSLVSYVQGGGMPPPQAPSQVAPSSYGLDPSVVAGVQNGFVPPPPQQVQSTLPEPVSMLPGSVPLLPPPPPPPPPTQKLINAPTAGLGTGMNGDEIPQSATDAQVASVTGGALPSQNAATLANQPAVGLPVASGQDQVIGSITPLTPKQVAANNKVYDAQQAQQRAFANSPEGIAQKADAENRAVIEKERQSLADSEAASAVQNAAMLKATQDSNERQAKQAAIDAAQRAKDQATTAQYTQQYAQQIKDAADFKVNTNRDVGASGMIAIALSGIGDALSGVHGPNAALEILNKRADQRIADQWAQKKALGDKAAGTKDLLETSRQTAADDRQDQDVEKAAMLTYDNNQIKLIAAQSANPMQKARALQASAALDQQVANLTTGLAQRKLEAQKTAADQQYKNSELGVQYGHLQLARDAQKNAVEQQNKDFALKVAELDAQGNTKAAAALKAQQAEVTERGAMVPTGINPDGTAHYEPAMQEGGKEPWLAEKGKVSEDLTNFRSATIDGVKAIDILRQKRSEFSTNEQFDNFLSNTEPGRLLLQAQARALLDVHQASGIARLSGEAVELAKQELSGGLNADSVKNLMTALDTSRGTLVDQLDSRMRGAGYTGKKIDFTDPLKANRIETPDEQQLATVLANPGKTEAGLKGTGLAGAIAEKNSADQGLESQKKIVDNWGAVINDPKSTPADKEKAAANLAQAVRTGKKGIKDYALSVQTQAAVNGLNNTPTTEDAAISSGSTAKDTSYGGSAQTAGAQKQIEQAPLDAIAQQANVAPAGSTERTDARQEIIRRAHAGDKKAQALLVQLVGAR